MCCIASEHNLIYRGRSTHLSGRTEIQENAIKGHPVEFLPISDTRAVFGLEVLGDVMPEVGKCHGNHAKPPLWTVYQV